MFPAVLAQTSHVRRVLIVALAALMLFAILVITPGTQRAEAVPAPKVVSYIFVFQHTDGSFATRTGTSAATGTSWDVAIPNTGGDTKAGTPGGMALHMSCSDEFGDVLSDPDDTSRGWSDDAAGQPNAVSDPEWRVYDYWIERPGTNGGKCGSPDLQSASISITKEADQTIVSGGTAAWTITVTNTGTTDLTNVTVTDALAPSCDSVIGDLDLGAAPVVYTCSLDSVTASFTNEAVVVGDAPGDTQVTDDDTALVRVINPDIAIEKTPDNQTVVSGSTATFSITVTNTGDVDLVNVTVTDANTPSCDNTIGALAAGASTSYDCTTDALTTDLHNVAVVTGNDENQNRVTDNDDANVDVINPMIDIEKSTNGEDADEPTGPQINEGGLVEWVYTVFSKMDVPLANVTVTDSDSGVTPVFLGGDGNNDGLLDPDELWIYKATGKAIVGQYENIGTVTAWAYEEVEVTDSDPSHYLGLEYASLTIVKETLGGVGEFFFLSDDLGGFSLDTTGLNPNSETFSGLEAGTYTVAEDLSGLGEGWTFVQNSLDCGDSDAVYDRPNALVTVVMEPGDNVTCMFGNQYEEPAPEPGSLTIVKVSIGGTETFGFTSPQLGDFSLTTVKGTGDATAETTFGALNPGTYSVEETSIPTHWQLMTSVCDDGSPVDAIEVAPEEHVTCTFTNGKLLGTAQGGDTVFLDKDKDGVQDADEPGINGAKVILKDADGNVIATQTTAKGAWDGFYKFLELDAGTYTFELDLSSVSGALTTAGSFTVTLVDGEDYLLADFGVAEELPKTGLDSEGLVLLAVGLLMLGAMAVLSTRKRREEN